jgi:hypothetical protein
MDEDALVRVDIRADDPRTPLQEQEALFRPKERRFTLRGMMRRSAIAIAALESIDSKRGFTIRL